MLGRIKSFITDTLSLPPILILIAIGTAAQLILNLLLHKPMTSACGLILPLIFGVSIEGYEIWLQYRDVGLFAPGNDPFLMILARHFVDVMIVLIAPIALVIYGLVR